METTMVLNRARHGPYPAYNTYETLAEVYQDGWQVFWDASDHLELQRPYHSISGHPAAQKGVWYKEPHHA